MTRPPMTTTEEAALMTFRREAAEALEKLSPKMTEVVEMAYLAGYVRALKDNKIARNNRPFNI